MRFGILKGCCYIIKRTNAVTVSGTVKEGGTRSPGED